MSTTFTVKNLNATETESQTVVSAISAEEAIGVYSDPSAAATYVVLAASRIAELGSWPMTSAMIYLLRRGLDADKKAYRRISHFAS